MRHSLQLQLPILLLLIGALGIMSLYNYRLRQETESREAESSRSVKAVGTQLAGMAHYLLDQEYDNALRMEVSLMGQYPDLSLAVVADAEDQILHASQPAWRGLSLAESPLAVASSLFPQARATMSGRWAEFNDKRLMVGVFAFQMPIRQDTLSPQGTGIVVIGIDQSNSILTAQRKVRRIATVAGTVLFLFTGLLWYALHRLLTRPVKALVQTTRAFSRGDYGASAKLTVKNELGELSDALDTLAVAARDREQVQAKSNRLAQIVESSINEIYVADATSFQIIDANRSARENLGYSETEILKLFPWDFAQEMTQEKFHKMISPLIDGSNEIAAIETVHTRKNGTTYPVSARLQYLPNQTPPIFSAIVQDITERQKQQAELILRDRAIAEVDVGVLITDARQDDNPIVYVNAAFEQMTGYSADEMIGHNPRFLQGNDRQQPALEKIRNALTAQVPVQAQLRNYFKDGTEYVNELAISPVRDTEGTVTHYIGIQRDVTERLATDARLLQAQKIDAIGQLSGGIAHDFNNLLNVIIGNIEFLQMNLQDPESRELANEVDSAAQMGSRLTQRLLAFARQGTLKPVVLNINDQLLASMELLQSTIGETISLTSKLSQELWTTRADPSEIENMVVNLAINARDAMPTGGQIHFETANVTLEEHTLLESDDLAPGDYVSLTVSDNGSGMTDEVKARIFEPFYTTKTEDKGTGLGLASIYGFAQQSGGHITVESKVNTGTTFTVYLPRSVESQNSISKKTTPSVVNQKRKAHILVVEDNDMVRKLTVRRLKKLGFETLAASDGPSALSVLGAETKIDLVLSDLVMDGGMSGYDVAQWVQENRPDCRLLLTSGFNEQLAEDNNLSSLQLLRKPCSIEELELAVTTALIGGDSIK